MPFWAELTVTVFLVIAGVFGFVGSYGLIKLPDPMSRLHAPTKATTLGVGGVLIASMVYFYATTGRISAHELMVTLFLLLTAPITALFIAKVHLHLRKTPKDLPSAGEGSGWASYTAAGPARGVRDFPPQPEEPAPTPATPR
ncbi:Na+/H+ antiporter subunit G [Pararhodobacter oceanensis]|uniref:Na+/H+ antiporter subunit G n=1 Tax=Pararhodobacter oceanensis TaxID=2172121 RepID=UPI003A90662D